MIDRIIKKIGLRVKMRVRVSVCMGPWLCRWVCATVSFLINSHLFSSIFLFLFTEICLFYDVKIFVFVLIFIFFVRICEGACVCECECVFWIFVFAYIVIMYWRWKPLKHLRIMSNAAKYKCTHSHTSMKWFRILSKTGPFRSMENPIKRNEKQSTRSSINQTYAHQIERWHRAKWNTKIPMHIL